MQLRWGLVGTGDIAARRVAPSLRDASRSTLVSVARRQSDRAEEFARASSARRWHADWRDLVRDPEIDAVYIATPVALHAPIAIAAAEAGKHVLCEKPMALSVAECDRMIAAARLAGVKLGIAYYRRFYPIVGRVRTLVAEKAIGVPVLARLDAFEKFDPPADHPRIWLLDPAISGGGPMFDFGCHRIEVLLSLFGTPAEARVVTTNALFDRPVEDAAVATLHFARGPLGIVSVAHAISESRDDFHIYGSEGSIHIPRLNGSELRIVRRGGETVEHHPSAANTHLPLVQQFVDAVLDGGMPAVSGEDGREVNRVLGAKG